MMRLPTGLLARHARPILAVAVVLLMTSAGTFAYLAAGPAAGVPMEAEDRTITLQEAAAALLASGLDLEDSDLDGLPDILENYVYGSDPEDWDTSGDGVPDGWLARHGNDPTEPGVGQGPAALPPPEELPPIYGGEWPRRFHLTLHQVYAWGRPADWDEPVDGVWESGLDPRRWDHGGQGIPDGWLIAFGLDPADPEVGSRRLTDDPLTVVENFRAGTDPTRADTDGDGLRDSDELRLYRTDPLRWDTGGHGIPDGWLVRYGLDASDPSAVLEDRFGKGMTVAQVYAYNVQRIGLDATLAGGGLHPTKTSTLDGPIPDGWFVRYGLDPLEPEGVTKIRWRASAWEEVRHLNDGLGGLPPIADLEWGYLDKYQWRKPVHWVEERDGPWFGGLDPTTEDTDGDGLPDIIEVRGWYIQRWPSIDPRAEAETYHVASDPLRKDTDGDGLTDLEEFQGRAVRDGAERTFPPTDPGNQDTAFSGLTDGEKVYGVERDGIHYDFSASPKPLDPTRADSSGGFIRDGEALEYWHARYLRYLASPVYEWPHSSYETFDEWAADMPGARGRSLSMAELAALFRPDGDLNGNGVPNLLDDDADGDGLADGLELNPSLLRMSGFFLDPEAVGDFPRSSTDPANPDTDGDGLPDAWEVRWGHFDQTLQGWNLDPTRYSSFPDGVADGQRNLDGDVVVWYSYEALPDGTLRAIQNIFDYNNLQEMHFGTNPNEVDEDFDGVSEGWRMFWGRIYPSMLDQAPGNPRVAEELGDRVPTAAQRDRDLERRVSNFPGETLEGLVLSSIPYVRFVETPSAEVVPLRADRHEVIGPSDFLRDVTVLREGRAEVVSIARVRGTFELTAALASELGTNPYLRDTDGDGIPDAWEALYSCVGPDGAVSPDPVRFDPHLDPDEDGLTNKEEFDLFLPPLGFATDPCNPDSDLGGLEDGFELFINLNPSDPIDDFSIQDATTDSDGDGIPDSREIFDGLNPFSPDTDGDGLLDGTDLLLKATDPRVAQFQALGIAHREEAVDGGPGYRFYGDPFPLRRDASGDGIPDGWLVYYGFLPQSPALAHVRAAYNWGKPTWWSEADHGVWWWGLDPRNDDADGDGVPDVLDHDLDGDGLNDRNGEDPVPYASNRNAHVGIPTTLWAAQARGDCAGNPRACRAVANQADYDGDGVPDRLDRAPTRIMVDDVAGAVPIQGVQVTVHKGAPFLVNGSLVVDCQDLSTPFRCGGLVPPPLPNRPVFVSLSTATGQPVVGVGVTDAQGRFRVEACLCAERTVQVPAGFPVLGRMDGMVPLDADPSRIALGTGHRVKVWTYNTTASFHGLGDASADATHPQHTTIQGLWDGQAFMTNATRYAEARPAATLLVRASSVLGVTAPTQVGVGQALEGSARLVDGSGLPLANMPVQVTWDGSRAGTMAVSPVPATDAAGTVRFSFPADPQDPGRYHVRVAFQGSQFVAAGEAAHAVDVQFPTVLHLTSSPEGEVVATGQRVTLAGTLVRAGDRPVAGHSVHVTIGGAAVGSATTTAGGAFQLTTSPLPALPAGIHDLRVDFAGTPVLGASHAQVSVALREGTLLQLLGTHGPFSVGEDVEVRGALRTSLGDAVPARSVDVRLQGRALGTAVTDGAGAFVLSAPWPIGMDLGTKTLEAAFAGGASQGASHAAKEVMVVSDTVLRLDPRTVGLGLPATVSGRLSAADGTGLVGRVVNITWAGKDAGPAVTGPDGRFGRAIAAESVARTGEVAVHARFEPGPDGLLGPSQSSAVYTVTTGSVLALAATVGSRAELPLEGRLLTTEGVGVPGADVMLRIDGSTLPVRTEPDGSFKASALNLSERAVGPVPWSAHYLGNATLSPAEAASNATLRSSTTLAVLGPRDAGPGGSLPLTVRLREDDGRDAAAVEALKFRLEQRVLDVAAEGTNPVRATLRIPEDAALGPVQFFVEFPGSALLDASSTTWDVLLKNASRLAVHVSADTVRPRDPVLITVQVTDVEGRPLRNVDVGISSNTAPLPMVAVTDAQGQVGMYVPAPDEGDLVVAAHFVGSQQFASSAGQARVGVLPAVAAATSGQRTVDAWSALVVLLAVVALLTVLLVAFVTWPRHLMTRAFDRVIHRLEAGDSYSAAVLLAYKRLSVYLRRFGFIERPGETAREFVEALSLAVRIEANQARILVELFERARYDPMARMGASERVQASEALRRLRLGVETAVQARRNRQGVPG